MPLAELREGETVAAQGSVRSVHERRFRGHGARSQTTALLEDGTGVVTLVWFNQPWIARNLRKGERIHVIGPVGGAGAPAPDEIERCGSCNLIEVRGPELFEGLPRFPGLPEADAHLLHDFVEVGIGQATARADTSHHCAEACEDRLDRGGNTIDVFHDANVRAGLSLPQRVLRGQQPGRGSRRRAHAW